ncbi:hypothetical protein LX36DRAFT_356231 [Colletotrichum falcatum]|nr:hypothetical protein LX36DRAFT_356231 [Colletotrichum falcatum]
MHGFGCPLVRNGMHECVYVRDPARRPVLLVQQHGCLVDFSCSPGRRDHGQVFSAANHRPYERTGPPARIRALAGRHMLRPRHVERAPPARAGVGRPLVQQQQSVPVPAALRVDVQSVQSVLCRVVVMAVPVPMHPERRRELADGSRDLVPRSPSGELGYCGLGYGGSLVVVTALAMVFTTAAAVAAAAAAAAAVAPAVAVVVERVAQGCCRQRRGRRRRQLKAAVGRHGFTLFLVRPPSLLSLYRYLALSPFRMSSIEKGALPQPPRANRPRQ